MDHITHNIANVSVEGLDTCGLQNCRFKHQVHVKISVRENNSWENANDYIFKHLARDRSEEIT